MHAETRKQQRGNLMCENKKGLLYHLRNNGVQNCILIKQFERCSHDNQRNRRKITQKDPSPSQTPHLHFLWWCISKLLIILVVESGTKISSSSTSKLSLCPRIRTQRRLASPGGSSCVYCVQPLLREHVHQTPESCCVWPSRASEDTVNLGGK